MSATDFILPRCPICSGEMSLNEVHPSATGMYTCVFRCVACLAQYPREIASDLLEMVRAQTRA